MQDSAKTVAWIHQKYPTSKSTDNCDSNRVFQCFLSGLLWVCFAFFFADCCRFSFERTKGVSKILYVIIIVHVAEDDDDEAPSCGSAFDHIVNLDLIRGFV